MILVVGGTGFVGGHVIHTLRAEDRPVRALARRPQKEERLRAWGCEVVQGDLTDGESLRRAAEGVTAVVQLVALPPFSGDAAVDRVMIEGNANLVAAAQEAGVERYVLMSALGTREDTQTVAPYYRAKWAMEEQVRGSGLTHTIFRPSFIFGPDGGMLPSLLRVARLSPVLPVPSDRRMQPIWADDVAAYFARALAGEGGVDGTWELGGPDEVSWAELYDRIRRILGKRRLKLRLPLVLEKVGAAAIQVLPQFRGAPEAVAMLDHEDNVTDIGPAVEAFGIKPLGLDDQIRRAA